MRNIFPVTAMSIYKKYITIVSIVSLSTREVKLYSQKIKIIDFSSIEDITKKYRNQEIAPSYLWTKGSMTLNPRWSINLLKGM